MFDQSSSREILEAVAGKLTENGMHTIVVPTGADARARILQMVDPLSEVMLMTSITLETMGLPQVMKDGGYTMIRDIFTNENVSIKHKRELGAAPDVSIASAHAVTKAGEIIIVSGTGSQMPAVAYGAGKAILVIGAQKIVENIEEGMKRVYEYVLPLESIRANKAYNKTTGSSVNKILMIKKEAQAGRIEVILVEEKLGF